jgi:Predicted periplasmic or secreted lipoprotein
MRSDAMIQKDVIDEVRWDPRIRTREIGVACRDAVVTLTGSVGSYAEKSAAEQAAERVAGVKAVAGELEVVLPAQHTQTDATLAHRVVEALRWDIEVPNEKLKVLVRDGWVQLDGQVEWQYQKDAAVRAVRNLTGVRGVTNAIALAPPAVSAYDVSKKIKAALHRQADLESDGIAVLAHDNVVTLKGTVPTFAERRAIEWAAWSAPGVREVHDELRVGV